MPSPQDKFIARKRFAMRLACLLCAISCHATRPPAPEACAKSAAVVQVARGIYVRFGHPAVVFEGDEIANIGFVVGDRCVAVIDSGGSVAEGQALDCAIRAVTDRPVCFVLNTHVHPDHTLGNAAFRRPGAEFIGHEKLRRAMALRGDVYLERASVYEGRALPPSMLVFPERGVSGVVEIDIGKRILTVTAHRSAHTDHDLSIVDEETKTAFLGDLVFLEHVPVIDGSINGWIGELEDLQIRSLAAVVPGHGPAQAPWPSASRSTLEYLADLRANVRDWIAHGGDLASAQDSIGTKEPDRWLLLDRYHRRNVGAAYAELEWED